MEWLFGHRMTPEEMLRKNQRALNKAMRDLDRERMKMEQQEKKVIADIKKLAKDGQMVRSSPSWGCSVAAGSGQSIVPSVYFFPPCPVSARNNSTSLTASNLLPATMSHQCLY